MFRRLACRATTCYPLVTAAARLSVTTATHSLPAIVGSNNSNPVSTPATHFSATTKKRANAAQACVNTVPARAISSPATLASSASPADMTYVVDRAFSAGSIYTKSGDSAEMTYAGALSFLRRVYSKRAYNLGASGQEHADVVVSGIPFDGAVTYRSGSRLGPRAIREASVQLAELLPFPSGKEIFSQLGVIDFGDVALDPHNQATVPGAVEHHARAVLAAEPGRDIAATAASLPPAPPKLARDAQGNAPVLVAPADKPKPRVRMLTFGGDHFVTYPLLRAHAERYGTLSLIHFDAHSDTWECGPGGAAELNHGTMFRHAADQGLIDPRTSIQIGIRTHNPDTMGFNVVDAPTFHRRGTDWLIALIRDTVGATAANASDRGRPVYLSFDIDALDPAFAPGTGTPVPGGLTSAQALEVLRALADPALGVTVVGADVVEVAPAYDNAEITAIAAAHVATEVLVAWAGEKERNGTL